VKRWLLIALVGLVLLALAGPLTVLLLLSRSRIDTEHFEAIREGMTQQEVEKILGGPPRNECSIPVIVWIRREGKLQSTELDPGPPTVPFFADAVKDNRELVWVGKSGLIATRVGDDGIVREKYFSTVHSPDRPAFGFPAAQRPRANPPAQDAKP
jgi:hypothetical protein